MANKACSEISGHGVIFPALSPYSQMVHFYYMYASNAQTYMYLRSSVYLNFSLRFI